MLVRLTRVLFLLLVLATAAEAQLVSVSVLTPQPVAPGTSLSIQISNDGSSCMLFHGAQVSLMAVDGDPAAPPTPVPFTMWGGNSGMVTLTAPVPAPGAASSYLLFVDGVIDFHYFNCPFTVLPIVLPAIAHARLDVGGATPFPTFHAHASNIADHRSFAAGGSSFLQLERWLVANATGAPQTLGATDRVELRNVGSSHAFFTESVGGEVIAPHGNRPVFLPTGTLAPGPYEVWTFLTEPSTGLQRAVSYGLRIRGDAATGEAGVSLRLPAGREIPLTGSLPVALEMDDFFAAIPSYHVLLGMIPGTAVGPFGVVVPVAASDPLLALSLGEAAHLIGGASGTAINPTAPAYSGASISAPITLVHPGPAYSGFSFRVLAVAMNATPYFGASQGELVTLM